MKTTKTVLICLLVAAAAMSASMSFGADAGVQWWGKPPGERPTVHGTVANVSATNIAIQTNNGIKPFVVNEKTRVMVRGKEATIADVHVGDPAIVRFRLQNDNVPLAMGVLVTPPTVHGKVASIEGDTIVLRSKDTEHRVSVTSDTVYKSRGYEGTLADVRVGYHVVAAGEPSGDTFAAVKIHFAPAMAKGAVTQIDGDVIMVKTVRQLNLTLQGDSSTVVLIRPRVGPNKKGTPADIQVGMPVNIGFHPSKDGACQLLWIDLLTGS